MAIRKKNGVMKSIKTYFSSESLLKILDYGRSPGLLLCYLPIRQGEQWFFKYTYFL